MNCPECNKDIILPAKTAVGFTYCRHDHGKYSVCYFVYKEGHITTEVYKGLATQDFDCVLVLEGFHVLDESRVEKLILLK